MFYTYDKYTNRMANYIIAITNNNMMINKCQYNFFYRLTFRVHILLL